MVCFERLQLCSYAPYLLQSFVVAVQGLGNLAVEFELAVEIVWLLELDARVQAQDKMLLLFRHIAVVHIQVGFEGESDVVVARQRERSLRIERRVVRDG